MEETMYRRVRCDIRAELAQRQDALIAEDPTARPLTIQAPMVRCSRAAFRETCRRWGTDVTYTHMFIAESIARSAEAREAEISFVAGEQNIIAQIAAKDPVVAGQAAVVLAPYVDAIDLNCGCPQKWAIKEGIGSALMQSPQLVSEMVKAVRAAANIPCVVKTRVFEDPAKSVDWARQQEAAGASWVTIHGRFPHDPPSHPVRWETVKTIRESLQCPLVLNGGVDSAELGLQLARQCGVGGVMSARGILANPALFAGYQRVPRECLRDYVRLSVLFDTRASVMQHHVLLMLESEVSPQERASLAQNLSVAGVIEALRELDWLDDDDLFAAAPPHSSLPTV
jgi:tRNA-dihydrouridine synthase